MNIERNNVNVRCRNEQILAHIIMSVLEVKCLRKPRFLGKGNVRTPLCSMSQGKSNSDKWNRTHTHTHQRVIHAKRMKVNGLMTQRVAIAYEGEVIPLNY